ncbi:sugar transferase [Alphaproteobacteria bacterium]|nr:sugar transferase [Alphaproteobacteria bacterium]
MNLIAFRLFDFIFSFLGLIFATPMMAVIVLFGFFETGAPIFWQERLGRDQVPFTLIKFRTMSVKTASVATHLANPGAVTPFGRFLRRTKLDELPQLWNVFKGEMSLVGPRPGLPNHLELTRAREVNGVFCVRPGITGLAQISGVDMSKPELLAKIDAEMIATISIKNYFKYIFLTIVGKGHGDRLKR